MSRRLLNLRLIALI